MNHKEIAIDFFKQGYNCAQAVVMAFADMTGLDAKQSARLASSFGGGLGRMREVCGTVSGMATVLGILYGYDDPKAPGAVQEHYARMQEIAGKFKELNGSIVCRELLGGSPSTGGAPEPRTAEYYKKRPCADLVGIAAEILDDYITRNPL